MSFLRKLFGGATPEQRLVEGERLIARGELGLARFALEAAAARGEPEVARAARARLAEITARLRAGHLAEARALAEAGEDAAAREALGHARSLGAGDDELAAIEAVLSAGAREPRHEPEAEEPAPAVAAPGEPAGPGDEELGDLDRALLAHGVDEARRLRALVAVTPDLGRALVAAYGGRPAEAEAAFARLGEPAVSEPRVLVERARSLLELERASEAEAALARAFAALPDDPDVVELRMEARAALGDTAQAAAFGRRLIGLRAPDDPTALVECLVRAGEAGAALGEVDRALDARPGDAALWALRAALCQALGSEEGVLQADRQVLELYAREAARPGRTIGAFPLASARRLAAAGLAEGAGPQERRVALELVRMLAAHDPEERERWRRILAEHGR